MIPTALHGIRRATPSWSNAMNWLSPGHLILILVVALLLFGNRLPEVARSIGRAINEFKRGMKEVGDTNDDTDAAIEKQKPQLRSPRDETVPAGKTAEKERVPRDDSNESAT